MCLQEIGLSYLITLKEFHLSFNQVLSFNKIDTFFKKFDYFWAKYKTLIIQALLIGGRLWGRQTIEIVWCLFKFVINDFLTKNKKNLIFVGW